MVPIVIRLLGAGRDWPRIEDGAIIGAAIAADADWMNWRRDGLVLGMEGNDFTDVDSSASIRR